MVLFRHDSFFPIIIQGGNKNEKEREREEKRKKERKIERKIEREYKKNVLQQILADLAAIHTVSSSSSNVFFFAFLT